MEPGFCIRIALWRNGLSSGYERATTANSGRISHLTPSPHTGTTGLTPTHFITYFDHTAHPLDNSNGGPLVDQRGRKSPPLSPRGRNPDYHHPP